MRRNSKIKKYCLCLLAFFILQGCKPDSTTNFINNVKTSTSLMIEEIINYNYTEFFHSLKNAYITSKRNRYPETQYFTISTNRDGQLYAYNGIIKECEQLSCNIKTSKLQRNTIFPENTTAYFEIEIPIQLSQQFQDAISKYGKITTNEWIDDTYIEKDLEYYNNELNALNLAKTELENTMSKKEVFNADEIKKLVKDTENINNKILYIKSDINYLTDILNKKLINITIQKEYNSTSNKVKTKIQNVIYFASDYMPFVIIVLFILAILWIIKMIKLSVVKSIKNLKVGKKKTNNQPQKINEPHL